MRVSKIEAIHLDTPKQFYDVVNANPYNNFFIQTNSGYICSHNCFFDEISFIKNQDVDKQKQKANDMIDTAIGGMKTRFFHQGKNPTLLVLASSKRSDKSFLEEHMKKKLKSEKDNVYISDGPVWEVKPPETYALPHFKVALGNKFLQSQVIPDGDDLSVYLDKGYKILDVPGEFKADFLDDIDRALCDFAGISSSEISKYISGIAWRETRNDQLQNLFTRDLIEVGNDPDDAIQYRDYIDLSRVNSEMMSRPLFVHLDMSVSGDKTGIAGVWIKRKDVHKEGQNQSNELHLQLAFSVSVKAPKGRQISFDKNRQFIYWLKSVGFNLKGISTDTFQSVDTGQSLTAKGYNYSVLSVDRVDPSSHICLPYQYFRSCIYERRIETYESDILTAEVIDLERNINTGKVDHPDGGCFTGDTKVKLLDGSSKSFLDLVDDYSAGKENFVYSINLNTKRVEPKRIAKAWKTLENQPLVRITLDNGEFVECTLNHRFMLGSGSYIEAKDLLPGKSLMSLPLRCSEKDEFRTFLGFDYDSLENCCKPQQTNKCRQAKWALVNHKVAAVEFIDKTADVYDIEVEGNHNFALDCGVFVHNSKDVCDAVCGAAFNASKHAEEFAFDFGESLDDVLKVSLTASEGARSKRQIQLDFEDELAKITTPQSIKSQQEKTDDGFVDFGNGSAKPCKGPVIGDGMIIW